MTSETYILILALLMIPVSAYGGYLLGLVQEPPDQRTKAEKLEDEFIDDE